MRRLSVRLVVSHLVVALLGGLATYVVVRLLAPVLFEGALGLGRGGGSGTPGMGPGPGAGGGAGGAGMLLRQQFADAVNAALLIGGIVGVLSSAIFGALAARRLLRPLGHVREATRQIASGHYDVRVPESSDAEVAALASDVNSLATTLASTEARRVRLLGEVAHELRTPLTVLGGSLEGMIDGVLPTDPEGLEALTSEVRRLRRLADDLSTLSKAEEGRLAVTPVRVALRPIVADAVTRLAPQASDAGITLTMAPGEDFEVDADADRIAQVVTNLVGNAIRATPDGGTITVRVDRTASMASLSVADTGEGLSADDLDKIFERFYRVPGRRGGDRGSGIGLTICRQLMRAHGGDLVAASPGPGLGATFTASLPVSR